MSKVYQLAASEVVHVLVAGEINLMKEFSKCWIWERNLAKLDDKILQDSMYLL